MLVSVRHFPKWFKVAKPVPLGRWTREHEMRKIDLANHDHCGGPICSNTKLTKSTIVQDNLYDNSMEMSICALQSFHVHPSGKTLTKK